MRFVATYALSGTFMNIIYLFSVQHPYYSINNHALLVPKTPIVDKTCLYRQLISSVSQLSRSLSDFAEMLNSSSYSNILARYQQDLLSFSSILEKIEARNGTVGREMLAEIKAVEKLFYGDETDLMKVDTITEEQVNITNDVLASINEACNKTEAILHEVTINETEFEMDFYNTYSRNNCQGPQSRNQARKVLQCRHLKHRRRP